VVVVAVAVVALVAGGLLWWRATGTTELERAVGLAPSGAERMSWTDWQGLRTELDADLSAESSTDELSSFLDDGFEADLTSGSALLESAPLLHERFAFSPASIEWELLTQSEEGAALTLRLPESADFDELADGLEGLGYTRPDDDDGVWRGGPDMLARIGPELTPELQYVALDEDDRLVRTSDTEAYLEDALEDTGDQDDSVADVVDASGDALSAAIYSGAQACRALAMSSADRADQDQAAQLVEEAGEVNPLAAFAMSAQPGGDVRVVLAFEGEDQARTNADSRAVLARGPAPGQGGDFTDRFRVGSVTADEDLVTMRLEPVEGQFVLSDLTSGPVLFATC
jgi:hypothetical protein